METGLEDILNGNPELEAPPPDEAETAPPAETMETRPRDEHGRFLPKGETAPDPAEAAPVPEAAPPAAVEEPLVPRKALQDERSKRQALEDEIRRLQHQFQQFQNPPEPPPSIFDDEVGWEQHFRPSVVQEAVQQASLNARLDISEMMARQSHPDFEEKRAAFLQAMQTTPGLQQRAIQDPHPWDFAYRYIANQERMEQLGAVDVTDLEAKLRAQIEAEYAAKANEALKTTLPGVPPSLSAERNVGSRQGPAWAGPSPLSDILNRT